MNLFATASNFSDGTNTPPAIWNGTSYVAVNSPQTLTLNVQPSAGDTISFTGSCIASATQVNISYTDNTTGSTSLLSVTMTTTPTLYSVVLPTTGTDYQIVIDPGAGCTSDTATLTPTVSVVADCGELGRVTRSYVSAYTAARNESRRIRRFAKRCLVANFNGQMPNGPTITKAKFETTSPWSSILSEPRIENNGRNAVCDVMFNYSGYSAIQVTAQWSNGEVSSQMFEFDILDRPIMPTATYAGATGPYAVETP